MSIHWGGRGPGHVSRWSLAAGGFSPASLFAANEPGAWYDPSDFSTLYTGTGGVTPVTAPGTAVSVVLDKRGVETVKLTSLPTMTCDATVSQSGNVLTFASSPANAGASGSAGINASGFYRMSFTVAGTGNVYIYVGATPVTFSPGTHTLKAWHASGSSFFIFRADTGGFNGTVTFTELRETLGNHLSQPTLANRPIYGIEPFGGRRNLLTYTEQFDNASWNKTRLSAVTANATTSPDGTADADKLVEDTTAAATHGTNQVFTGTAASHTFTVYAKAGERSQIRMKLFDGTTFVNLTYFDLAAGTVGSGTGGTITNAGNGWYRCSVTGTLAASAVCQAQIFLAVGGSDAYTGDGTSGVYIWGAQLETGSTATAYQRVTDQWNVTQAGVPSVSYLQFDGSDDWLVSPTITPGINKAQVFAGVRKLSDAAENIVLEQGIAGVNALACTPISVPAAADAWQTSVRAGGVEAIARATLNPEPQTAVISSIADYAGATLAADIQIRVNQVATNGNAGVAVSSATFGTYPLYIGRRGGTSNPFNGRIYQMLVRFGANLSADQISQTETWVNSKTGAY